MISFVTRLKAHFNRNRKGYFVTKFCAKIQLIKYLVVKQTHSEYEIHTKHFPIQLNDPQNTKL